MDNIIVKYSGKILKYALFIFVISSLVIALFRIFDRPVVEQNITLYEQLAPNSQDQVLVVLFHFRKRCEMCLNMEKYTRDFIEAYNRKQGDKNPVEFKLMVIDDDHNANLVNRFNLYTSTIVLVNFENSKVKNTKVLVDAWQLYRDQEAFTERLKNEMNAFMENNNE